MSIHWGTYRIIEHEVSVPWHVLTPADARRSFEKIMSERAPRVAMLGELVEANGFSFGSEDSQLQSLNDFFRLNVERGPDAAGYPSPGWCSVAYDIGLYAGEVLIQRFPHLYWALDKVKKSISFNRPVIVGFSKAHPRYNLPIFDRFISYGYQIVNPGPNTHLVGDRVVSVPRIPVDEGLLLRLLAGASKYA